MSKASMIYHTLFVKDDGEWFDVFGDFEMAAIREEIEWGYCDLPKKDLIIVKHRYDSSVPAIIYDLNTKGKTTLGSTHKA
jgi:hypothetical protein